MGGAYGKRKDFVYEAPAVVNVTGVNLNKTSTELTVGGNETLTVAVLPDNATDKTVTWSSSDESVATVDNNGTVTAVGVGMATITVTATNGTDDNTVDDQTATCTVTVKPDNTALNDAITAAETLYDSIKNNNDYTDIASTLKTAIDAAKTVAGTDDADQDTIDEAAETVTTAKINTVIGMIDKLPTTVTADDKEKIEAVRAAYDSLSDTEKTSVTNSSKLTEAETALKKRIRVLQPHCWRLSMLLKALRARRSH